VDTYAKASSSDRVAHFKKNLTPHDNIRYSNDAYHKTIVQLNWYDQGRSHKAVVNLKRTFDIFGLFEGDSLSLSPRAMAILDDLGAAIISERINTRMYAIAGHSVIKGDKKGDQQLSVQRAQVVKDYLKQKFDISDKRLMPVGFGSYNLKDKQNVNAKKNNRIELCLIEEVYGFVPNTNISLPDANSPRSEGIMVTTSGSKTLAVKKDKKPRRLAYARNTESHKARPLIKKIRKAKRKVARRRVSKTTEYSARQTSRVTNKRRRTAYNSGVNKARVAAQRRVAKRRSPYDIGTAVEQYVQDNPYAAYGSGYVEDYRYDDYQSAEPVYSYGGYGEQNVRCQ